MKRFDWQNTRGPVYEPSPVDTSPPRRAVMRHDRWYVFPGVLEAIEYARGNAMNGAQVFVDGVLAATIESLDYRDLFDANDRIPCGYARQDIDVLEVA